MNLKDLIVKKLGLSPEEAEQKAKEWEGNAEIEKALNDLKDLAMNPDGTFKDENAEKAAQLNYESIQKLMDKGDENADEGKGKKDEGKGEGENKPKKQPDSKKDEEGSAETQAQDTPSNDPKIQELEKAIADLQAEKKALMIDSNLKLNLLDNGAKLEDIEYLVFKIKKDEQELNVDEKGNIKDLDGIMERSKKGNPNLFSSNSKKILPNKLQDNELEDEEVTKEQFEKMSYAEKNELFKKNRELYDRLSGKK